MKLALSSITALLLCGAAASAEQASTCYLTTQKEAGQLTCFNAQSEIQPAVNVRVEKELVNANASVVDVRLSDMRLALPAATAQSAFGNYSFDVADTGAKVLLTITPADDTGVVYAQPTADLITEPAPAVEVHRGFLYRRGGAIFPWGGYYYAGQPWNRRWQICGTANTVPCEQLFGPPYDQAYNGGVTVFREGGILFNRTYYRHIGPRN